MLAAVLIAILGAGDAPGPAPPPEPRALFDAYRRNVEAFRTLKLQWRREDRVTDASGREREREVKALVAQRDKLEDGSEAFHAINARINEKDQARAAGRGTKAVISTYLTDRNRFMLRIAPRHWAAVHDDDWLMPDVAVDPATMSKEYVGFTLIAYQGDSTPFYRWYTGMPPGVIGSGQVMLVMPAYADDGHLPPFGATRRPREAQWRHPIDALFQADPQAFRTVGRATVDGREVVVIEGRIPPPTAAPMAKVAAGITAPAPPPPAPPETIRAYLDPARGALPLKVEWFPPGADPAKAPPSRVMEVTEILAVPGAGSYPARGTIRTLGPDPDRPDPAADAPTVPHEEITWHAAKVEGNAPLNETFALTFPDGSYYYDQVSGRSVRVGHEAQEYARLPWALSGILLAGWAVYAMIAAASALARRSRRLEPGAGVP